MRASLVLVSILVVVLTIALWDVMNTEKANEHVVELKMLHRVIYWHSLEKS